MKILKKSPYEPEAIALMDELSRSLEDITGSSGRNSFDLSDVCAPRSIFVIAYDDDGEAVGCGGIRPINEDIAEVKRMFARKKAAGVGTQILLFLEAEARKLGYSALWVETRLINKRAVSFYKSKGYNQIPNYGNYVNNSNAICFEKQLF